MKRTGSPWRDKISLAILHLQEKGVIRMLYDRWWKRPDAGKGHGRVTLRFDDETLYVFWFDEE